MASKDNSHRRSERKLEADSGCVLRWSCLLREGWDWEGSWGPRQANLGLRREGRVKDESRSPLLEQTHHCMLPGC